MRKSLAAVERHLPDSRFGAFELIDERGFTQTAAAELLKVTQPRISDLVRGKRDRFSVDSLIEMLGHAGAEVSFVAKAGRQVA